MSEPISQTLFPTLYDDATAREIGNRAMMILASKLPGCTVRQFDVPLPFYDYTPIEPCFTERGPIAPVLSINCGRNNSAASFELWRRFMFRSQFNFRDEINLLASGAIAHVIPGGERLDAGPEAIAEATLKAISRVDFGAMIDGCTIQGILANQARPPDPWINFYLGECAAYVGDDDEARILLKNAIKYAEEDRYQRFANLIVEVETLLSKLNSHADALRQELRETVEDNWSHFKVVSQ